MTKRTVLRLVIEQRYRHEMIMPWLASFSRARAQICGSNLLDNHDC
jgi:hypothetical protein